GGSILSSQVIGRVVASFACGSWPRIVVARRRAVHRRADRLEQGVHAGRGPGRIALLQRFDHTAADHYRIGEAGDPPRGLAVLDPEADADRKAGGLLDARHLPRDLPDVDVGRTGHALERNVVHVAARELRHRGDAVLAGG